MNLEINKVHHMDCLEGMKHLPDERDAVLGGDYARVMEQKGVIGQLIKALGQKTLV